MVFVFPDAHGRAARWDITFDGKTYRNVRGLKPYYISVPKLDSILFVTGVTNATFYLARLDTRQITKIDGGNSPFGTWTGWDSSYPVGASNFVASADSNGLSLVTLNDRKRVTEYLDLKKKQVEARKEELINDGP